jgi:two-component system response regulator RpfG
MPPALALQELDALVHVPRVLVGALADQRIEDIGHGDHTRDEIEVMKSHPRIGYDILKGSPSKYLSMGAIIALGHHEKYDGSGYPNGLHGEDIPLVARVVAVADVFDALVSERPYKHAWPLAEGLEYLKSQRSRHFDPRCVDAFLGDHARIEAILAEYGD